MNEPTMGFFYRSKSPKENVDRISWNLLTSEQEVDEVVLASNGNPQVILKHSPRCGTSFFVKNGLDSIKKEESSNADFHLVDVIRNRSVSMYLAEKLGIRHESPQAFVLKEGEVSWHGSHHRVNEARILEAVNGGENFSIEN